MPRVDRAQRRRHDGFDPERLAGIQDAYERAAVVRVLGKPLEDNARNLTAELVSLAVDAGSVAGRRNALVQAADSKS